MRARGLLGPLLNTGLLVAAPPALPAAAIPAARPAAAPAPAAPSPIAAKWTAPFPATRSPAAGAPPVRAAAAPRPRMEVTDVVATPSWTTLYWRLVNPAAEAAQAGRARTGRGPGVRLVGAGGRAVYRPLTGTGGACLCTRPEGRPVPGKGAVEGFATFAALPPGAATVRVEAPAFGLGRDVPVRRSPPARRDDGTGFSVEGIDRLPYATVLRVRKRPTRHDQAPGPPERLATAPDAPLAAGEVVLVDPRTGSATTPLYGPRRCMCADFSAGVGRDGTVRGVYVFPALPLTARPRVWFTGGLPLDDVPVRDVSPPAGGPGRARSAPPAWPQPVWPPTRPGVREVTEYPRADRVDFAGLVERPGARQTVSGRQTGTAVLFGHDSAALSPAARRMLRELAAEISRRPDIRGVRVTGHADQAGPATYNLRLSERRAEAVAAELERLVTRRDVAFSVLGRGEDGTAGPGVGRGPARSPAGLVGSDETGRALGRNATVVLPR